ncbi:hypothetical protein [Geobacter sp. SVR]|nr:hypothetical protein [Geobacter sp. SVR]BCS55299.1 hypothetical protein GSVR_36070 [Geobacter sp. SVR]GCF86098.1 hypothetical protein GSbR_26980 [Geobacter sp. SVR]
MKKRAHIHGILLLILVEAILLFACVNDNSRLAPDRSFRYDIATAYPRY